MAGPAEDGQPPVWLVMQVEVNPGDAVAACGSDLAEDRGAEASPAAGGALAGEAAAGIGAGSAAGGGNTPVMFKRTRQRLRDRRERREFNRRRDLAMHEGLAEAMEVLTASLKEDRRELEKVRDETQRMGEQRQALEAQIQAAEAEAGGLRAEAQRLEREEQAARAELRELQERAARLEEELAGREAGPGGD